MKDLRLEVNYSCRGYISTSKSYESITIFSDVFEKYDINGKKATIKSFLDGFKKCIRLFNSEKVFSVEIVLYTDWDKRIFLVNQSWQDKDNGIYTLLDYRDINAKYASENKVSKSVLIKTFEKYLESIQ